LGCGQPSTRTDREGARRSRHSASRGVRHRPRISWGPR